MTAPESSTPFKEVPPSQAPQLIPTTEDSNFLSPGGVVAGVSAFAEGATSTGRSKAKMLFIRIVVTLLLISLVVGGVWRFNSGML